MAIISPLQLLAEARHWATPSVIYSVSFLLFIAYAAVAIKTWYRLRMFKGPWLGSFSELWLLSSASTGKMHLELAKVCDKYGDGALVRVGPNELVTSDPEVGRYMSAARLKHHKAPWYASLKVNPYVDNVFSELDPEKHDALRACMASAFSLRENKDLDGKINEAIQLFVDLIERKYVSKAGETRPMDFGLVAQYFSLDVVTSMAFGEPFGYLEKDEDVHNYIKIVNQALPFVSCCSAAPTLGWLMNQPWVLSLLGPSPTDKDGLGKLMGLSQELLGSRFGPNKVVKSDMVGSFLAHGMSRRQAESEILTQVLAGSDTTSTSVRSIFLHIISCPPVYAKLQNEIDRAVEDDTISMPISNEQALKLPYLQACIKEGMRIWPPFTGMLLKKVNPGGETINGVFVPGGTSIGHCAWGMQRRPEFGPDVEVFRPERWLEADDARRRHMEKTVDIIFGSGRWACLGKSIVYNELNKIFVELLRRFDFSLLNPVHPWESRNYTLFLQNKMWVRITKRENSIVIH